MQSPCAYVTDYGEREAFERNCTAQGILKIYDKVYPFWKDLKRIDSAPFSAQKYEEFTRDTARFSAFLNHNTNLIHCKFGCVFVLDSKKLFRASESELVAGFEYFLNKFAKKHFDKDSLNMLCEAYLKHFLAFKGIYKVEVA